MSGMKKVDAVVLRETGFVALCSLVMSALMQAVFLVIGRWDISVLIGNAAGFAVGLLNFFLLGITVQNAVGKEEKDARNAVKLSHTLRCLMIVAAVGVMFILNYKKVIPVNLIAMLIPILFPGVAVKFRMFAYKKNEKGGGRAE